MSISTKIKQLFFSVAKMIEKLPDADVQHVVTCEKCKYHFDDGADRCMKLDIMPPDSDFYCGFGKE